MYIFSMQLFWSMHRDDQSHLIPVEWQKGSTYDDQTPPCVVGSCFPLLASMQWVWNDKVELDTAALESSFATCPSKEDKARVCNETQELWRMAGSLQCGCPPLGTHSWTWHEGDWPRGITSWYGMPRYSRSTASLGRQWEPFGDAGLWYEELNYWAKKEGAVLSAASGDRKSVV